MITSSPFSDTRFEYEIKHLYYLQETLYEVLEKTKPCFLIGSRGTGKTTLLRSLSWRERLSNDDLKKRLGGRPFRKFIGLYIKLPDVQLDAISDWLEGSHENVKRSIYSRYLELIQLQEMLESVSDLETAKEFRYDAIKEYQCVKKLLNDFGDELYSPELGGGRPPTSFYELSQSVRMLRRFVEKASQRELQPSTVLDGIGSPTQIGELSRRVADSISATISNSTDSSRIFFKVCFDEAETLDAFGVKVLATWVRLSTGSLQHVVSFVSKPSSLTETLLPNLTVQSADVVYLDLDDIKDKDFRAFAEGVTTLRIKEVARHSGDKQLLDIDIRFDTEQLFGKLNLNLLLEATLRESVSPFAKQLLDFATSRAETRAAIDERSRKGDDSVLPIYEAYLELKTRRSLPKANTPRWSKRRASSQLTRKAMIAAYLSIMSELKSEPRYAYADMILQVSDSCIRDFLNNLEYIYRESKLSLVQFLKATPVKHTIQNAGLLAASRAKVKSLPMYGVNHPSSTAKVVKGLGHLTQLLQSGSADGVRHLRTTERGLFQLATASDGGSTKQALELIVDAAEAGFLKITKTTELMVSFRVHTSLAPSFSFSYRGAYYPVAICAEDILLFADAPDDVAISKCSRQLFTRIDDVRSGDLFQESFE